MKRIVVKKECLPSIVDEDKFISAIQLGRIVGAIRCNNILQADNVGDDESNLPRRIYLLINHAALLYEGIKNFNNARSDYEELTYYKNNGDKMDLLISEFNDRQSFSNVVLKSIRDKIAFHFDKDVITSVLRQYVEESVKENKDIFFISGRSELVKDMAYTLADNLIIKYILQLIENKDSSEKEKFKLLASKLLELSALFCTVIDELIPDLVDKYCELREEKD